MPRTKRIVIAGMPHHITHRGNHGEDVFFREEDHFLYMDLIKKYSSKYGLDILAYCMMTNHIHLVVVPKQTDSIGLTIRDAHQTYSLSVNRQHDRKGHVWEGRYYSCVLDDMHLLAAIRYVEANPVRAGMAEKAEFYPHSSASAHCGLRDNDPFLSNAEFVRVKVGADWSAWLMVDNETTEKKIRTNTKNGYPCGADEFIEQIEKLTGRELKKASANKGKSK